MKRSSDTGSAPVPLLCCSSLYSITIFWMAFPSAATYHASGFLSLPASAYSLCRAGDMDVKPCVSGHDRHIVGICCNDGEVRRIQTLQIFITEHRQPPSRTRHPAPVQQSYPPYSDPCPGNTSPRSALAPCSISSLWSLY